MILRIFICAILRMIKTTNRQKSAKKCLLTGRSRINKGRNANKVTSVIQCSNNAKGKGTSAEEIGGSDKMRCGKRWNRGEESKDPATDKEKCKWQKLCWTVRSVR